MAPAFPEAPEYGRSLPGFTVNLLVRRLPRSIAFYRAIFGAELRYRDADFAALRLRGWDFMLHADHTYAKHPWRRELRARRRRGLGAELRIFGLDPDAVARRAARRRARILKKPWTTPHGWRETTVVDPDGYTWAVGVPLE